MRRTAVLAVLAALIGVACGPEPALERGSPAPENGTTSELSPSPKPLRLPGASCRGRGGGSAQNVPDFVSVDLESRGGTERVTFHFRPQDAGVSQPPSHYVKFADRLLTDAEGKPAEVEGEAFVQVIFSAFGVDLSGEQPVEIYRGPKEFHPRFGTVLEVEQLGDFEATVTWGIGLSTRACFVVDARPDRLILEFPSA